MTIMVGPMGSVPISHRRPTSASTPIANKSRRTPEIVAAVFFHRGARPTARKLIR